jgi:hypothetical protein
MISLGFSVNPQLATGFTQNSIYEEVNPIFGISMGFDVSLKFNDIHSIESGIHITKRGYTIGGKYDLHDTLKEAYLDYQGSYPTRTNMNHIYYFLDIPLSYKAYVLRDEKFTFFLQGGIVFNLLYGFTIQKVEVYSNGMKNKESSFMRPEDIWVGNPRSFNLSGLFAFGFNFEIGNKRSISISPNLNITLRQADSHFDLYFLDTGISFTLWYF